MLFEKKPVTSVGKVIGLIMRLISELYLACCPAAIEIYWLYDYNSQEWSYYTYSEGLSMTVYGCILYTGSRLVAI